MWTSPSSRTQPFRIAANIPINSALNSASESLYFGVPLLCYPQTAEQGAVAARICRLGAGKTLASPSVEDIKAGLKLLMEEGSFRANAEKIGESFRRCGGARAAADKIESMIK